MKRLGSISSKLSGRLDRAVVVVRVGEVVNWLGLRPVNYVMLEYIYSIELVITWPVKLLS